MTPLFTLINIGTRVDTSAFIALTLHLVCSPHWKDSTRVI